MKMKFRGIFLYIIFLLVLLIQIPLNYAGTTGKIMGIVRDRSTGELLIGANIMVENTILGAAADMDGKYIILNVPPGTYTLKASMMGYQPVRVTNVGVSVDLTREINFSLESTVLETGEAVTIVAEKPMVVKDLTATTAVMNAGEIDALPVTEVSEAIELQAGLVKDSGGGLHVRGGRTGELSYWIDGVPITDVYDGGAVVDVNKDMVQELQVVSGAFNAEYGQAMSGIVNITTKEGDNNFGGSFSAYMGDYLSSHKDIFMQIDDVDPLAIRNIEGSFNGPLVKDKVFFYLNARSIYFDGWLSGERRFNPNAVTTGLVLDNDYVKDFASEYWDMSYPDTDSTRAFAYALGSNAHIDSMLIYYLAYVNKTIDPDSFNVYYERLRETHKNGKGDGKRVPMNWNRKNYLQGKLIYRMTPSLKFSYNYIMDDVDYTELSIFDNERDYIFNPDGAPKKFKTGVTHIAQLTHTLSSRTFYRLDFSYFSKRFQKYVYEDIHDPRYIHPDLALQEAFSFKTAGTSDTDTRSGTATDSQRFKRETRTYLGKLDLTSQITSTHQVKTGVEYRQHNVFSEGFTLRPIQEQTSLGYLFDSVIESPYIQTCVLDDSTIYHSTYRHNPVEFSVYLQDKMEFKNMIVNLGIRFDYFEPDGVILNDESDPSIYNPIRPENRYHDYGTDGIPNTHDADGTEGNGFWDTGETAVTLAERQTYWYKKASPKFQVGPRLGVSFPITERGVIHFSYGHFFQIPRFERLYQNPDFELGSGTGNVGVIGNADLKPEKTVSGEIGLQQQLTNDISMSLTGYFRDVRDLAGTRAEEIVLFGGASKYSKFVNSDFGFIRGIILALNKRFSGGFSASADYTMQLAKGTNSDPEAARNALAGGSLPEVQLTSLDWDQTHTINATVSYGAADWGTSLIAQWGSGLPYTPRRSEDITSLLTNSQRKPSYFNVDLKAYKVFKLGPGELTLFLRVFNLLDQLNEINVYDDTGRAGFTHDEELARATNPFEYINSLDEWYNNPTHYSEPRRIELGITYNL